MENDKLNNGEKPPASTSPVQENVEFFPTNRQNAADSTGIFHNGSSAGADSMSFPNMPFPVTSFPWNHMQGTYQPYTHSIPETCDNLMVDLNQLHNLQNPPIYPNSININSDITSLYRQDLHFPEGNVMGLSYTHDKTGVADTLMNDSAHFNGFQNHEINRNFTLIRGNAGGAHEMTRQGVGEAHGSNIHGPQIKNFVDLGGSTTMLYHTQNSGEINIDNNDQVSGSQFGCPQKIDGSFLSLGIGGKTDAKSKFDLSSRESTGKLDRAVFPQQNTSHVREGTGSSLNPGHNLGGGFSSFQNNVGGFRSPVHNAGGWTSSNNNVGVMCGADTSLNSSPFHTLQMPQPDMQRGFPKSSNRNLGFVGSRNSRYANFDPYKGFIGELATSSGPFTSSSAGFLDSGQSGASGVASEYAKFIRTTTRPTQRFVETVQNSSPEFSRVSPFIGFKGSSSQRVHSGQLFPASKDSAAQAVDESTQLHRRKRVQPAGQLFPGSKDSAAQAVDESTQLHRRKRVQPAGQLFSANGDTAGGDLSSRRIDIQATKDSAAQAAGSSLFPKRLGVQVHEHSATQAAGHGLFAGNQVTDSCVAYATGQGFYPKEIQVRTASWPELFSTDPRGPSFTTGCSQGPPLQFSNALLGPTSTSGQVVSTAKGYRLSQASNVLGGPSLKRDALRPHPVAPRVQRRKRTLQPPILPSMPSPPQTAPAAAIPIPAPVPQIKRQGSDGLPQPTGQKCMLCKRDLSFTPEGPVHQPKVPPAVAVLSCGHTFHDHCLQLITPEDQSKNPPCIPCAIGEI